MVFIGFRAETFGEKSIGPKMWKKFYSKIIAMIFIISKSIYFKTLSSRNIQPTYFDATNQPAKTFLRPKNHFDVLTYSGNSSSSKVVTGLEFEPDFVWIKAYSGSSSPGSQNHYLVSTVCIAHALVMALLTMV